MIRERLTKKYLEGWLGKLATAWNRRDIDKAMELFSRCAKYYEAPFTPPATELEGIRNFWHEIKHHDDVKVTFEVIAISDLRCVVNYRASILEGINRRESDGIYVIDFDDDLYCTEFKQWSVENQKRYAQK
jgi:hypothetical protein